MSNVTLKNNLLKIRPCVAREWHPTKNDGVRPVDVTPFSHKFAWWKCEKIGHVWQATIASRSRGNNCPYCGKFKVCSDNCLETLIPKLAKEWHPTKNKPLTPDKVMPFSSVYAWWKCKKGHAWRSRISSRSEGRGCPYCSGKGRYESDFLSTNYPQLVKEWHPSKNGKLTLKNVSPYSKNSFWWKCSKNAHEWKATISSRTINKNCPYCPNRKISPENSLSVINPKLASEWHPTKNGKLKPTEITPGSTKRAWWICKNGHEWDAKIGNRNNGSGCPECAKIRRAITKRNHSVLS